MIVVRRANERFRDPDGNSELWHSFVPHDRSNPLAGGFGPLEFIDEERLPPGRAVAPRLPPDAEVLTYVHEGTLAYRDSMGHSGIILAGEFQRMAPPPGRVSSHRNASKTEWAHVFRVRLRSAALVATPGRQQKRFTVADRKGRLCLVASPDGRAGSLEVDQDAQLYSSVLERGQHQVHELARGRRAWLHVVEGKVSLGSFVLSTGDGAGVTDEAAISITALDDTTLLLVDVGALHADAAEVPVDHPAATGGALFAILWDGLVDVLGSAATAVVLSRAARRARAQSPELAELVITRAGERYHYLLPPSFAQTEGLPRPLMDELRALLMEQTGGVVLRFLARVPALEDWAA